MRRKDERPKRLKPRSTILLVCGIVCIPGFLSIPVFGWGMLVFYLWYEWKRHLLVKEQQAIPFGHFRGEGPVPDPSLEQDLTQ